MTAGPNPLCACGSGKAAERCCAAPSATDPATREPLRAAALAVQAGDFTRAERLYTDVLSAEPDNFQALYFLGLAAHKAGRHGAAADFLRDALAAGPGHAPVRLALAQAELAAGQYAAAEQTLRPLTGNGTGPADAGALRTLGRLYAQTGRTAEAVSSLRRAVRLEPASAAGHTLLGNALQEGGDYEGALEAYRQALCRAPDRAQAWCNLGALFHRRGRMAEAAEHYQRALALDPRLASAWNNLGSALLGLSRPAEAETCLQTALALDPDNADAQDNHCAALSALGRDAEALICYQRLLRINPGHERAQYFLSAMTGVDVPKAMPPAMVTKLFDEYAENFDRHLGEVLQYRTPARLRELWEAHGGGRGGLRMLDLGCGTGLCGEQFAPFGSYLHGVDLSPRMLDLARARGVYHALEQADLVSALARVDEPFDLAVAADVFVYVGDLEAVFAALRPALTDTGRLLFSTEAAATAPYELRVTGRYAHHPDYFRSLAAAHGFAVTARERGPLRLDKGEFLEGDFYLLSRSPSGG